MLELKKRDVPLAEASEILAKEFEANNSHRELRADGSVAHVCQFGRGTAGPWKPCTQIGSEKRTVPGARDVGLWSVKNRALRTFSASFGEGTEACFAIHRQGQAPAAKHISGPAPSASKAR